MEHNKAVEADNHGEPEIERLTPPIRISSTERDPREERTLLQNESSESLHLRKGHQEASIHQPMPIFQTSSHESSYHYTGYHQPGWLPPTNYPFPPPNHYLPHSTIYSAPSFDSSGSTPYTRNQMMTTNLPTQLHHSMASIHHPMHETLQSTSVNGYPHPGSNSFGHPHVPTISTADGRMWTIPPPALQLPIEFIMSPEPEDVLCGRGGATNSHSGNKEFRRLVKKYQDGYLKAKKRDKPSVASNIVDIIRQKGGRFLRRYERTMDGHVLWVDVGDEKAREKTCQALRENAPELRRKKIISGMKSGNNSVADSQSHTSTSSESPRADSKEILPARKDCVAVKQENDLLSKMNESERFASQPAEHTSSNTSSAGQTLHTATPHDPSESFSSTSSPRLKAQPGIKQENGSTDAKIFEKVGHGSEDSSNCSPSSINMPYHPVENPKRFISPIFKMLPKDRKWGSPCSISLCELEKEDQLMYLRDFLPPDSNNGPAFPAQAYAAPGQGDAPPRTSNKRALPVEMIGL